MIRLLSLLVALCANVATATPSPAIHIDDQLLGTNDGQYFVKRTIHYHPPTYYQGYVDEEVVTLSIWTGKIQSRCLLRRVFYEIDVHTDEQKSGFHRLSRLRVHQQTDVCGTGQPTPRGCKPLGAICAFGRAEWCYGRRVSPRSTSVAVEKCAA